jgi:hypothetical protein
MIDKDDENVRHGIGRRLFDDAKFITILIAIVGFLTSGMVYNIYAQIEKKVDLVQHNNDIAAVNKRIDDKFDAIKSDTNLLIELSKRNRK